MKLFLQSFDAKGDVDPTITGSLLNYLSGWVSAESEADAVVVVAAYRDGYQFNRELYSTRKPIILLDYLEHGWDADTKENRLGHGALCQFGHLASEEWAKFDQWVKDMPPRLTFKRELLERDRTETLLPIEFPCRLPAPPLSSKEQFEARPIEVFNCWGLSHPSRQRLHGDIFRNAHERGIHVVDSWEQDNRFEGRTWATIHSPHYLRKPIQEVMRWQERAKISVSLPGAGVKCFRSAEAPVGSIMALPFDELAWSFPWDAGNCLRVLPPEFYWLITANDLPQLYDIYRAGQDTIDRYRSARYASEYVMPAIGRAL